MELYLLLCTVPGILMLEAKILFHKNELGDTKIGSARCRSMANFAMTNLVFAETATSTKKLFMTGNQKLRGGIRQDSARSIFQ